ncbi:mRNA capping enzyme [Mycena alexandri]|uniref:mRNA guanylyltransferase n=1 Tax=Mycena alexandri TaxID=1745969 RepID=A0AAD6SM36_9AGAR|nr:mRNA capping enzyme [Mycena alexandri]
MPLELGAPRLIEKSQERHGGSESKRDRQTPKLVSHAMGADAVHHRLPGSQPLSFAKSDFAKRESARPLCEKSDGLRVLRVLFFVNIDPNSPSQTVYPVRPFSTLTTTPKSLLYTIVDGELVYDVDPRTKQETLRFLAFDCLVVDEQNIMARPLDKRCGRLEIFFKPFDKMKKDYSHVTTTHPSDLKCKPPSENSIDFKLVLRFPPLPEDPSHPDSHAKPVFLLHVWCGDTTRRLLYVYCTLAHRPSRRFKASDEQYDDHIVEVRWDALESHWKWMRFRPDKPNGNHRIVGSMADGVEKDTKTREAHPPPVGPPPTAISRYAAAPPLELRYGRLATSQWSRVVGPLLVWGWIADPL